MTNLPTTFKDISLKLLDLTSDKKFMVLSTDSYHKWSIKSLELKRRSGQAEPEVLANTGENMRKPLDFKLFLQAGENKLSFSRILLQVWCKAASRLKNRIVVLIVDGKAYKFIVY